MSADDYETRVRVIAREYDADIETEVERHRVRLKVLADVFQARLQMLHDEMSKEAA